MRPGVQVPYGAPNPVSTERYLCRWLGVRGAGGGKPLRRVPSILPIVRIHIRESKPLSRIATTQRSKRNDSVCNSRKGDVEVVAYTD